MISRKVKIMVFYKNYICGICEDAPTLITTIFIMDECYLLDFLPSLIRADIERVEIQEYDK